MGLFGMFKVLFGTAKAMRDTKRIASEVAALPMEEFVPRWLELRGSVASLGRPVAQPPATQERIEATAKRLALALPADLADFLRVTDGVTWTNAFNEQPIASTATLAFGSASGLAAAVRKHWEEEGQEAGEPQGIQVFNTSLVELIADEHDKLLPFSDLDDCLVLQPMHELQAAAMIARPHKHYPAGTVLALEGSHATRYPSLRAWLAGDAAMLTSVGRMKTS